MKTYEYKCQDGHLTASSVRGTRILCSSCPNTATRVFDFHFKPPMREHFNNSTGTYVSNEHDFTESLKRQSEEASIRTGIEHTFEPVTPTTSSSVGVTDQGLYEQARSHHDSNLLDHKGDVIA